MTTVTTQPTAKAQNAFDWLCWILVLFAALCLAASVPQTFTMVRVAHDDFGASLLVIVLEVMAFFALLAPLWVPTWAKTFDGLAYFLLGITTIGNYAGGWNYVWKRTDLEPFWLSIRDWTVLGVPLATILLVGVLAGLVPAAMKFFVLLAIKRYRENELDRSPDAVADRMIEPMMVQILATQKLQARLVGAASMSNNPLLLTDLQPSAQARSALADLGINVDQDLLRLLTERAAQRQEGEQRRPFEQPTRTASSDDEHWFEEVLRPAALKRSQAYTEAHTCDGRPLEDFCPDCYARWEDAESGRGPAVGAPTPAQPSVAAWDEDEDEAELPMTLAAAWAELDEWGWNRVSWEAIGVLPDSPEKTAEIERRRQAKENLKNAAIKFAEDIGLLKPIQPTEEAQARPLEDFIAELPPSEQTAIEDEARRLLAEMTSVPAEAPEKPQDDPAVEDTQVGGSTSPDRQPAPEPSLGSVGGAVATWQCDGCTAEGSNGAKGKARSWSKARSLGDKLYCKECRDSGNYGS